jgi:hypothetical protein
MQRHTTTHLGNKTKRSVSVIGHTTRSIAQIFVGLVFNVFTCMIFVAKEGAVACRPPAVTPRLWSGFLVWLL